MKRIIRLFAGVLIICASSAAMAQSADGGMRIAVVSMETQRPLEGVTVTVTDRDGKVITGRTAANGTVELSDLDTGLYAVTADGPGLVAASEPSVRVVGRKVTPLQPQDARPHAGARGNRSSSPRASCRSARGGEQLPAEPGGNCAVPPAQVVTSCERWTAFRGWYPPANSPASRCVAVDPWDNLILIDDLPFDRVIHFDQTLGGGGGHRWRWSLLDLRAEFHRGRGVLARRLERCVWRALGLPAEPRRRWRQPDAERQCAGGHRRAGTRLRGAKRHP